MVVMKIFIGLAIFLITCHVLDKLGFGKAEMPAEAPPRSEELGDTPPLSVASVFLGTEPDGDTEENLVSKPTIVKEVYPPKLGVLRTHAGFKSCAFEDLWRETTGITNEI